jgi:hypothetical protein
MAKIIDCIYLTYSSCEIRSFKRVIQHNFTSIANQFDISLVIVNISLTIIQPHKSFITQIHLRIKRILSDRTENKVCWLQSNHIEMLLCSLFSE